MEGLIVDEVLMDQVTFVESGRLVCARLAGHGLDCCSGYIDFGLGGRDFVYGDRGIGAGDFRISSRLSLHTPPARGHRMPGEKEIVAAFCFSGGNAWKWGEGDLKVSGFVPPEVRSHGRFGFGSEGKLTIDGHALLDPAKGWITTEKPFVFEVVRSGDRLRFLIDGRVAHEMEFTEKLFGKVGFTVWGGAIHLFDFSVEGDTYELDWQRTQPVGFTIPVVDVSAQPHRQVVVARGSDTVDYQHPSTVLMEDGKTMLCPWTYGHGGALGPMKRSDDGGMTWRRVETPEDWSAVENCPTIHRLTDPDGVARLIVQGGMSGVMMQAVSEDGGLTWSGMKPNGLSCTVAPITIEPISGGRHLALFHAGRAIFMSISSDGGVTWCAQIKIAEDQDAFLCEPAIIRSPDGKQLAAVMRENSRWYNSQVMFSDDDGATWSCPEELPGSLNGDRHLARYDTDGRIVMVFRDSGMCSSTRGDFVGWVGTYEDLVEKREGQCRLRLIANSRYGSLGATGYPGLERLPDGTFVATSYAVIEAGQNCSIVSVRFTLSEIDGIAKSQGTLA